LLGLTRGFMRAGAPRVVASLWKVSDQATAALMDQFYRALLLDKVSPAAALRSAQLALKGQRRFAAPFDWAGFILQGEWRPMSP
jgi:CHAT domain-containing protein